MANVTTLGNSDAASVLQEFDLQLQLARAAELASSGRYLEAEAVLCARSFLESNTAALDLLARIYIRQWRFTDARKCWAQAVSLDDDLRSKHEKNLNLLDSYEAGILNRRLLRWRLAIVFWSATLFLASWSLYHLIFIN